MHTDPHKGLHSEQGALRGEHQGRAADPVIKVVDLAWLEFGKPDLDRAETFARDFGFTTVERTPAALRLRGALPGTDCLVIRKSPASRFTGPVFQAADLRDLRRLADATGGEVADLEGGGRYVSTRTPSGIEVRVVHGAPEHGGLDLQRPLTLNCGARVDRVNAVQRPPREPARVERLGHVVLSTTVFLRDLDWFLEHLGLIVSDFLYLDGQRGRGPTMAFIRCDRGGEPADHHTLAMHLGPSTGYVHSAYQVADLDALATGGEYLKERGYRRSWGIGGISRAARSSTTGATPTGCCWSTSPTATASTPPSSRAGPPCRPPGSPSGDRPPPPTSSAAPRPLPCCAKRSRPCARTTNST